MTLIVLLRFVRKHFWVLQLCTIIFLMYMLKVQKRKTLDLKSYHTIQGQQIEKWKDKAGKNHARAEMLEIKASNAKLVLNKELRETIKKEIGNLKRNLISYQSVQASTIGGINTKSIDTVYVLNKQYPEELVKAKQFKLNDPSLIFNATYIPSIDTFIADYQVKHHFEIFHYYKRPGTPPFNFLRRKRAVAEIKFDNPGSQADSTFAVALDRKPSFLKRVFGR